MKLTSLLLKLSDKFGRLDTEEYEKLKLDTEKWWSSIETSEEKEKELKEKGEAFKVFEIKLKKWSDKVLIRFVLIGMYIWLYRAISDYMNPKEEIKRIEEDN